MWWHNHANYGAPECPNKTRDVMKSWAPPLHSSVGRIWMRSVVPRLLDSLEQDREKWWGAQGLSRRYLTVSKLCFREAAVNQSSCRSCRIDRIDQRGSSTWWQTGEKWVEVLRNRCCLNFMSDHAGLTGNRWSGWSEPGQSCILLLLSRATPQVLFCSSVVLVAVPACRQQLLVFYVSANHFKMCLCHMLTCVQIPCLHL